MTLPESVLDFFGKRHDIGSEEIIQFVADYCQYPLTFYLQPVVCRGEYQVWAIMAYYFDQRKVAIVFHFDVLSVSRLYSTTDVVNLLENLLALVKGINKNINTPLWAANPTTRKL